MKTFEAVGIMLLAGALSAIPAAHASESSFWDDFAITISVEHLDYDDLEIDARKFGRNDLGMSFSYPTLGAQNRAEDNQWEQNFEVIELAYNPWHSPDYGFFLGFGFSQTETGVSENNVDHEGYLGRFGSRMKLFELGKGFDIGLRASYEYGFSDSRDMNLFAVPGTKEKIEFEWQKTTAALIIGWKHEVGESYLDYVRPFVGVKFEDLKVDEAYEVTSGVGTTEVEYEVENGDGRVHGLIGARFSYGQGASGLDFGISLGSGVVGFGITFTQEF